MTNEKITDVKIVEVKDYLCADSYWRIETTGVTVRKDYLTLHEAIDICNDGKYSYEIIKLDDKHDVKAIYQDVLNFIKVQASAPSDDAVTGFIDMLDKTYNVSKKPGAINGI